MLDIVVSVASIISSLGVIVGIFIAIAQLKKATTIAVSDHSRRKKEATIDFYDRIREKSQPLSAKIKEKSDGNPVTVQQIEEDPELMINISQYLSLMERLAVGIHADVFDYEIYRELSRTVTINNYHQLREYIVKSRKENQTSSTFIYFERLAQRLEKDQNIPLPEIKVKQL